MLVHGLNSDGNGMQNFANTMMSLGTICDYYNLVDSNTIINKNLAESKNAFDKIESCYSANPNANVMVKVSFSNDKFGSVDKQTEELATIIENLNDRFHDKKIVTVGHSKGGVVSMNCAIENPGYIDKLISIGTPYTTTIFEHLIDFVCEIVENICLNSIINIYKNPVLYGEIYVLFATNIVKDIMTNAFESISNKYITKKGLKQKWNSMTNKPKFTPIATRALVINGCKESDFAVPVESALADGFEGKSFTNDYLLVKDDNFKISITAKKYATEFVDFASVLSRINGMVNISNALDLFDYLSMIIPFLLSINDENDYVKRCTARYVHAQIPVINDLLGSDNESLNNPEVALRVLAGLND